MIYTKLLLALLDTLEQSVMQKINGQKVDVSLTLALMTLTQEERLLVSQLELDYVAQAFGLAVVEKDFVRAMFTIDWPTQPLPSFTVVHLIACVRAYLQSDKQYD